MASFKGVDLVEDEDAETFPPQLFVANEDEDDNVDVHPQTAKNLNVQPEASKEPGLPVDKLSNMQVEEPKVGMEFDSPDELFSYYTKYARQQGFAVAKRSSRKGDDKKLRHVVYECNKRGKARSKRKKRLLPRPQIKVECNAHLSATVFPDGKWRIRTVENVHNHQQSPGKSRHFNCNRVLDRHTKRRLELNDAAGIRQNKTIDSLQLEAGGLDNLPFTSRDCRNYLAKVRRLRLGEGDAEAMHRYFMKMKADNEDFFYAMDLDEEGRLRNVFWADARSRAACKEFGDVVTFDTTYLVNRYDMPFAPFVGVNHHGHSILLGCGLISHEDTQSFSWLFDTWMTCMWGCAPKAIITDQCIAMKNAIEVIFPDTRHRWCIWHIMKKVPEKLGAYKDYEKMSWCMRKAVYDTLTVEDFEASWVAFVNKYHLEDNSWLQALYLERNRWVPAYVKDMFWAGMSSTQRSEGMNAYFDGYINSKTTLKQFVDQYEIALKKKVEIETQADARSWNSYIPCITPDKLEKQFQCAYTHNKFSEFQGQFSKKLQCQLVAVCGGEHVIKEWVKFGENEEEQRVCFKVVFNSETNEAHCNCRLFEFKGMVCSHQLMVWNEMEVQRVPDKYILRRWCKNVRRAHTKIRISYDPSRGGIEAKRHDILIDLFKEIVYMAEDSKERFQRLLALGQGLKKEFEEPLGVCDSTMVDHTDALVDQTDANNISCSIKDGDAVLGKNALIRNPKAVKKPGRPRTVRLTNHSDKVVNAAKQKHTMKRKAKEPKKKKKQSIDTTEDRGGTKHDVINVTPNPVGMASINQCYNTSQSHLSTFLNSQSWMGSRSSAIDENQSPMFRASQMESHLSTFVNSQNWMGSRSSAMDENQSQDFRASQKDSLESQGGWGYMRGGYLADIADAQSPHTPALSSQVNPIFGFGQRIHLLQPHTPLIKNQQHQRLPYQVGAQYPTDQSMQPELEHFNLSSFGHIRGDDGHET